MLSRGQAIDGTNVSANASQLKSLSCQRLGDQARRIGEEHDANDAADDEDLGERPGGRVAS